MAPIIFALINVYFYFHQFFSAARNSDLLSLGPWLKNIVNLFCKKYLVSSRLAPVLHLTPRDWTPSGGAAVAAGGGSGGDGEEAGWPYEVDCREGGQDD